MMKDRVILHAIRQAFEGMIDSQTYPSFVLFITMPPEELDINVHPAKHEVRFHQSRQVHDLIYKSVSDALLLSASTDAIEFENDNDNESTSSNVTSLYEVPKHSYQQPEDKRAGQDASNSKGPNADYIAPLRSGPNADANGGESRTNTPASYTPQAKGFESKGSQRSSFQGKVYHGAGQVSKSAASSYQNLMSAGSDSSNKTGTFVDDVFPFLLSDSKQLVFVQGHVVCFLPAYYVPAQVLYEQIQASGVQQPLLMPVSVKQDVVGTKLGSDDEKPGDILQRRLAVLKELGFDIQSNVGKWILKQVPACLRQLPWVSILPKLLDPEHSLLSGKEVVRYICFCWGQSHEFTYAELQNWFQAMPQTRQSQLIEQFAQTVDIPTSNFSLDEN
jgi:DNA mismatch repair protein MutL